MSTVTVLAQFADLARGRLEKLQRRAARYGQSIEWAETARVETRTRPLWDGSKEKYAQPVVDFDVRGEAPRVGPYRFVAEVERTPGGNIIAALAGVEIGELGREWDGRCEHCNTPRRRLKAYVVEHAETGERKIVGKSCLRDHTGQDTPAGAIALFEYEREPLGGDAEEWCGGFSPWYESTRYVIAAARAAIALFGWRPNSACHDGERSTSACVALLWARGKERETHKREIDDLRTEMTLRADEYVATADAILAWGADLAPRSDYEHNLKIALAGNMVTGKTFGLVVSACAAFDKQQAVVVERAERAKAEAERAAASFHYGAEGTRYRGVDVTVDKAIAMPDRGFGPSVLYVLRTGDGALLKWFTGADPRANGKRIAPGDRVAIDFTVKRHEQYNGAPQTIVTRAKVMERAAA